MTRYRSAPAARRSPDDPGQPKTRAGASAPESITDGAAPPLDPGKPRTRAGASAPPDRYPGRAELVAEFGRLRAALSKLQRSPRPHEHLEGCRLTAEATELLAKLAGRAERAHAPTVRQRRRDADLARKLAKFDEIRAARGDQPVTTPPMTSTDETSRRYGTGGPTKGTTT